MLKQAFGDGEFGYAELQFRVPASSGQITTRLEIRKLGTP